MAKFDWTFAQPDNVTTFQQQLSYFNSLTDIGYGGSLGIVILIVLYGIIFSMTKAFSVSRAAGVTFVIGTLFAGFLRAMDLIGNVEIGICISLGILGLFMLLRDAEKYES